MLVCVCVGVCVCVCFLAPSLHTGDRAGVEQVRDVAQERRRRVPDHTVREDRGRAHDTGWVPLSRCRTIAVVVFFRLTAIGVVVLPKQKPFLYVKREMITEEDGRYRLTPRSLKRAEIAAHQRFSHALAKI